MGNGRLTAASLSPGLLRGKTPLFRRQKSVPSPPQYNVTPHLLYWRQAVYIGARAALLGIASCDF